MPGFGLFLKKRDNGQLAGPVGQKQKKFAIVLMHDVESEAGQRKCAELMSLEQSLGFRSSFNFVPERYQILPEVRQMLAINGFEVGVHGLNHDGKLFQSRKIFQERARKDQCLFKRVAGRWFLRSGQPP